MITKTIALYSFDELTPKAQENAIKNYRETYSDYWNAQENEAVLEKFKTIFPVEHIDWEYGYRTYATLTVSEPMGELELTGKPLANYIKTNYSVVLQAENCPLTGYYLDSVILSPLLEFIKKPKKGPTLADLLQDCATRWIHACHDDYEQYFSDEGIKGEIEANEVLFTFNGDLNPIN